MQDRQADPRAFAPAEERFVADDLDALRAELQAVSEREAELRLLLLDAHDQLLEANEHNEKLVEGARILRAAIEERTAWAERMVEEAEKRGAVIQELQTALSERTAWAERMIEEAEKRGAVIQELQAALEERTTQGKGLGTEAEESRAVIQQLQAELDRTRQALAAAQASRTWRLADWYRRLLGLSKNPLS